MDAIIDKEILKKKSEDKTVRPLEMQGRIALLSIATLTKEQTT